MDFLNSVAQQLRQLWNSSNGLQRAWFVALLSALVVAVASVGWWSSRPQYIPVAANLSPGEAAEAVSKLEATGIRTEMNFAGTSVLVPKQDFAKARMAIGDMAGDTPGFDDGLTGSLLSDPTMNRYRILQAKENQLETSLARMKPIASADVHIAQPEWTPFARDREEVTASVVLGLRPNIPFTAQQASTVVATVAGSVEGLSKDGVTVTDLNGRILAGKGMHQGAFSCQVDYRQRIENDLSSKAEGLLVRMLGAGKAAVRVTADIDFTQTERVETVYDPDGEVKQKETIESTTTSKPNSTAGGETGFEGNSAVANQRQSPITETHESSDVEYSHAKTTDTVKVAGGEILRLTVAAMVDLTPPEDEPNSTVAQLDKASIESVIKQAVGFDSERGDQIEVLYTSLAASAAPEPVLLETVDKWQFYTEIARHASLALAAIAAFALGFILLKQLKPVVTAVETPRTLDAERTLLMAEFASQAKENPEIVSRIVEAWMEVPSPSQAVPAPHLKAAQNRNRSAA